MLRLFARLVDRTGCKNVTGGRHILQAVLVLSALVFLCDIVRADAPVPVAAFYTTRERLRPNEPLTVDVTKSYDVDGDQLYITVNFGDGTTVTAPETGLAVHKYNKAGTYTVRVSVNDLNDSTVTTDGYAVPFIQQTIDVENSIECFHFQAFDSVATATDTDRAGDTLTLQPGTEYSIALQVLQFEDDAAVARAARTVLFANIGEQPSIATTNSSIRVVKQPEWNYTAKCWIATIVTDVFFGSQILSIEGRGVPAQLCTVAPTKQMLSITPQMSFQSLTITTEAFGTKIMQHNFIPPFLKTTFHPCSLCFGGILLGSPAALSRDNSTYPGLGGFVVATMDTFGEVTQPLDLIQADDAGTSNTTLCHALLLQFPSEDCSRLVVVDLVMTRSQILVATSRGIFASAPFATSTDVFYEYVSTGNAAVDSGSWFAEPTSLISFVSNDYCATETVETDYDFVAIMLETGTNGSDSQIIISGDVEHEEWRAIPLPAATLFDDMYSNGNHTVIPVAASFDDFQQRLIVLIKILESDGNDFAFVRTGAVTMTWLFEVQTTFLFPTTFVGVGLRIPVTDVGIYAYGNEVYYSFEGGAYFNLVGVMPDDIGVPVQFATTATSAAFAIRTSKGRIVGGRNGAVGLLSLMPQVGAPVLLHESGSAMPGMSNSSTPLSTAQIVQLGEHRGVTTETVMFDRTGRLHLLTIASALDFSVLQASDYPLHTGLIADANGTLKHGNGQSLVGNRYLSYATAVLHTADDILFDSTVSTVRALIPLSKSSSTPPAFITVGTTMSDAVMAFADLDLGLRVVVHRYETWSGTSRGVQETNVDIAEVARVKRVSSPLDGQALHITGVANSVWADYSAFMPCAVDECPAVAYDVTVLSNNGTAFANLTDGDTVLLSLQNVNASEEGWLNTDVGKTIHMLFGAILLQTFINSTSMEGVIMQLPAFDRDANFTGEVSAGLWNIFDVRSFEDTAEVGRQSLTLTTANATFATIELSAGRFYFDAALDSSKIFVIDDGSPQAWGIIQQVVDASTAIVVSGSNTAFTDSVYEAGTWRMFHVADYASWDKLPDASAARRLWSFSPAVCPYSDFTDNTDNIPTQYLDVSDFSTILTVINQHYEATEMALDPTPALQQSVPTASATAAALPSIRFAYANPSLIAGSYLNEVGATVRNGKDGSLVLNLNNGVAGIYGYNEEAVQRTLVAKHGDHFFMANVTGRSTSNHGKTSLVITPSVTNLACEAAMQVYHIVIGCPLSKRIVLKQQAEGTFLSGGNLKELPFNYRPPSNAGNDIPITPNIYNAHPAHPRYNDYVAVSRHTGSYKQCASVNPSSVSKNSQNPCGCTSAQRDSMRVEDSDCSRFVPEVFYTRDFVPDFVVQVADRNDTALTLRVRLTEVNGRTDWCIDSQKCSGSSSVIIDPGKDAIYWMGDQLYAFRAEVVDDTYCDLVADFYLFVTYPSLSTVMETVTYAITAQVVGFVLLGGYLFYAHKYGVRSLLKTWN